MNIVDDLKLDCFRKKAKELLTGTSVWDMFKDVHISTDAHGCIPSEIVRSLHEKFVKWNNNGFTLDEKMKFGHMAKFLEEFFTPASRK